MSATPAPKLPGRADALAMVRILMPEPGAVVELRALHVGRVRTVSGYFDDAEKLVAAAATLDGQAEGVYVTLNPVVRDLLARANNRLVYRPQHTTADTEINARRWLLMDFDPVRPSGISSTNAEKQAALVLSSEAASYLAGLGWPMPIRADSGNGFHLLNLIHLPADDGGLAQRVLQAIACRFDTDAVRIDQTVYNPGRICKLYGTLARKGDSMPERPHRRSQIIEMPAHLVPVSLQLLERVAEGAPKVSSTRTGSKGKGAFDVEVYLKSHGLGIVSSSAWQGGRKWILEKCPFNPEHTDRAAFVLQFPSGAIAAGCKHNSCSGKEWKDLRDAVEPGWQKPHSDRHTGPDRTQAKEGQAGTDRGASESDATADDEIEIGDEISLGVQAHMQNRRVHALFEGRGKPEIGPGGKPLNTSSEGYDFSFVLSLGKRGVRDPSELATALWHRPDEEARKKGKAYIVRTVTRALGFLEDLETAEGGKQKREANFQVDHVRIFDSDRPIYEFTIAGVPIRLSSADLISPSTFRVRFLDAHHRAPVLPEDWVAAVNDWLSQATKVAMPEDASEEAALREAISEAVANLSQGEEQEDLNRGMALSIPGQGLVFKTEAIVRALREDRPQLQRNNLCRVLRELGYEFKTPTIGEKKTRVWAKQDSPKNAREGGQDK